jgi:hypothetical protein
MRRRTHHIRDAALVTRVRDAIGEYLCSTLGYDDSLVDLDEEVATNDEEVVYRYRTDSQATRRIWFRRLDGGQGAYPRLFLSPRRRRILRVEGRDQGIGTGSRPGRDGLPNPR